MRKLTIIMIAVWAAIGIGIITVLVMGLSGRSVFGFAGRVSFPGTAGNVTEIYRESFPASEIDSISLRSSIGSVTVRHSGDNQITIVQTASWNLPQNLRISASLSGGTLTAGHGSGGVIGGMGNLRNRMEIFIPESYTGDVNLHTSTGSMTLEDAWQFGNLELTVTTGSLRSNGELRANNASITGTTGSIRLHSLHAGSMSISSSTGGITVENLTGSGEVSASTGSVRLSGVVITDSLAVTATTGSVNIGIKGDQSFIFDGSASTGSIRTYFGDASGNSARMNTTVGSPPHTSLTARASTGSIRITNE